MPCKLHTINQAEQERVIRKDVYVIAKKNNNKKKLIKVRQPDVSFVIFIRHFLFVHVSANTKAREDWRKNTEIVVASMSLYGGRFRDIFRKFPGNFSKLSQKL